MQQLIEITDAQGRLVAADWLGRAERVHRQLRPHLPPDYVAKMQAVFADGGRMLVAADGEQVTGVAVWRHYENTADGRFVYVDDLVTDELRRSTGVGRALLAWMQTEAKRLGCDKLTLDSGTQRTRAHAFYFREGMHVTSFHFAKALGA